MSAAPRGSRYGLFQNDVASGVMLLGAAAAALIIANSPLASLYFGALHGRVFGVSALEVVNDGLMSVFFLLVGLEIKRECFGGALSGWAQRALPGAAAAGGMLVPAVIYAAFNGRDPGALRGWAVPTATDIAFSLGLFSLLGARAPPSLKVFLAALAILDDLGAVTIIALFYAAGLSAPMLGLAALAFAAMVALNRLGVVRLWPYLALGVALWAFMLESGVHPTVAGVLTAFATPLRGENAPLLTLEHALKPWVAFLIAPLFAFANAGLALNGAAFITAPSTVPLGVALGLCIGKPIGVFGAAWLARRSGLAQWPGDASAAAFFGVALLCGVGFTMSVFIALLAFPAPALQEAAKLGVLAGSTLAGALGFIVLRFVGGRSRGAA